MFKCVLYMLLFRLEPWKVFAVRLHMHGPCLMCTQLQHAAMGPQRCQWADIIVITHNKSQRQIEHAVMNIWQEAGQMKAILRSLKANYQSMLSRQQELSYISQCNALVANFSLTHNPIKLFITTGVSAVGTHCPACVIYTEKCFFTHHRKPTECWYKSLWFNLNLSDQTISLPVSKSGKYYACFPLQRPNPMTHGWSNAGAFLTCPCKDCLIIITRINKSKIIDDT